MTASAPRMANGRMKRIDNVASMGNCGGTSAAVSCHLKKKKTPPKSEETS